MIATMDIASVEQETSVQPTLWGMDPVQLHDLFWASRGVCVVRPGQEADLADSAELFLLIESRTLVLLRMRPLLETLSWVKPSVLFVRLQGTRSEEYRETVLTAGDDNRFLRVQRDYRGVPGQLSRVAFTRDLAVAERWQEEQETADLWQRFRRATRNARKARREFQTCTAALYDSQDREELAKFSLDLIQFWRRPDSVLSDIVEHRPRVWGPRSMTLDALTTFVGAAWIGSGRAIRPGATVLGPAILWDNPEARPAREFGRQWRDIDPTQLAPQEYAAPTAPTRPHLNVAKRLFDIVFSLFMLLCTLPLYPFLMLAIWIEDGRPFFFSHTRETLGGREFGCLKFRSMRRNAESVKAALQTDNQADGPQFYIRNDPRLTRIGAFIRRHNIDELPQFINVLLSDMSVVGPRPSPFKENQYCPSWREARLSVRPGITGLWQISRTRRRGSDFQEWIKYDLEYVNQWSWKMELRIILRTVFIFIGR